MKLSKQDLKQKLSEKVTDEDVLIELLEDIEDSMEVVEESVNTEVEELKTQLADLKAKYKERFLKGDETPEDNNDDTPEMDEEEVIDVKEIF